MRFAAALLLAAALPGQAMECTAVSGDKTAVLVELYTSEGCSSCPPADRWLSSLGEKGYLPGSVVPLSLHVDYWDYIGWKDPYAKRAFSARQRKLTQKQRLAFVYTPQVMLQGKDFRAWGTKAFDEAVASINARPARASIALALEGAGTSALSVRVRAALLERAHHGDAVLYIAAYQNRLQSRVDAGENRGRLLAHDYVVLEWMGPVAFGAGGRIAERRALSLLPGARAADSGVVAFVQDQRSGEVLQALMLPVPMRSCP